MIRKTKKININTDISQDKDRFEMTGKIEKKKIAFQRRNFLADKFNRMSKLTKERTFIVYHPQLVSSCFVSFQKN